jgi:hypothetical protein
MAQIAEKHFPKCSTSQLAVYREMCMAATASSHSPIPSLCYSRGRDRERESMGQPLGYNIHPRLFRQRHEIEGYRRDIFPGQPAKCAEKGLQQKYSSRQSSCHNVSRLVAHPSVSTINERRLHVHLIPRRSAFERSLPICPVYPKALSCDFTGIKHQVLYPRWT